MVHVLQVFPQKDYSVAVYFTDGRVKLFDVKPLLGKGVFKILEDEDVYLNRCTVLNNTLAWDLSGRFDPTNCIDLDPEVLYHESKEITDPLSSAA